MGQISKIKKLNVDEFYDDFVAMLRTMSVVPVVGAGFSCGVKTDGGCVPSGDEYKTYMLEQLNACSAISNEDKKRLEKMSFREISEYYEADTLVSPEVRRNYLRKNFKGALLAKNDVRRHFFDIDWPYIYTLNIDDAIENSSDYKMTVSPGRDINDEVYKESKCVIKLHGHINDILIYKDAVKVFTAKEYVNSIVEIDPLLYKLKNDLSNQNIVYIGCSLDDEIDLCAVSSIDNLLRDKEVGRRTIFFTKGSIDAFAEVRLGNFGVTDIVCFDEYEEMYDLLARAGKEKNSILTRELDGYNRFSTKHISNEDIKLNKKFFFWGESLVDSRENQIRYPYYFVHREVEDKILQNAFSVGLQVIDGRAFSGKTYLMAGLYERTTVQNKYVFDGRKRLSDGALNELLEEKKALILIDTGVVTRKQIERIIERAEDIRLNATCVIIFVGSSDGDIEGLLSKKNSMGLIEKDNYEYIRLNNSFSSRSMEIDEFNKKMPVLQLMPYKKNSGKDRRRDMTFLDHHVMNEAEMGEKGRFSDKRLDTNMSEKKLACLITFAIKEKIYSADVEMFGFKAEIDQLRNEYPVFFEREETLRFEKDKDDLSSIKYVLNSKYWLRRELSAFAHKPENHGRIQEAFRYLITRVSRVSRGDVNRRWKLCRPYILYDVMNEVFINDDGGNILLIVSIYETLYSLLAEDYHFLHQNAKCLMNYSYSLKGQKKADVINKGINLAKISKKMMESILEESQTANMEISYAHVLYTLAALMSERCRINDYKMIKDIIEALPIVYEATENPYNSGYNQKKVSRRFSKSILEYIKNITFLDASAFSSAELASKRDSLVTKIVGTNC